MTQPQAFVPFPEPLTTATFLGRRKRFLADMEFPDGSRTVAHCPNTGSMQGCLFPGHRALLWDSGNPKRKLRYTWKAIEADGGVWVGIDTGVPNQLAAAAVAAGAVPGLAGFPEVLREKKMGERSRVDLLLRDRGRVCFVEVKNVTLVADGTARFPDAVTARGLKHLKELAAQVAIGHRAAMLYVVQRADGTRFEPAADIDPAYAEGLRRAVAAGVEAYALGCEVTTAGVTATGLLPMEI